MKHRKVCIGKHLSDSFPIQNGLKQGFRIRHWEGAGKPGGIEIERDTPASDLC
jgi:hypothetical protein